MSLQQDIIQINGKKVFINPFLYASKINEKSKKWLREPGQISKSVIAFNRSKFYPEIDWENLALKDKLFKETTIELFLKTIDLIKFFNPDFRSEQILEVEKKINFL